MRFLCDKFTALIPSGQLKGKSAAETFALPMALSREGELDHIIQARLEKNKTIKPGIRGSE